MTFNGHNVVLNKIQTLKYLEQLETVALSSRPGPSTAVSGAAGSAASAAAAVTPAAVTDSVPVQGQIKVKVKQRLHLNKG